MAQEAEHKALSIISSTTPLKKRKKLAFQYKHCMTKNQNDFEFGTLDLKQPDKTTGDI
jgi:hypothetical protein